MSSGYGKGSVARARAERARDASDVRSYLRYLGCWKRRGRLGVNLQFKLGRSGRLGCGNLSSSAAGAAVGSGCVCETAPAGRMSREAAAAPSALERWNLRHVKGWSRGDRD